MIFIQKTESYDLIEYIKDKNTTNTIKIAGFDLDNTLITTKSKKTFAINCDDWKFKYKNIKDKFKNLISNHYKIVIITNQLGISLGKSSREELITKITNISKELDINLTWVVLYKDNLYRKPRIKSFELFKDIDKNHSFYCGDAAGRNKDFSDTDYKFAKNLNIEFYSDYYFFIGVDDKDTYTLSQNPTINLKSMEFEIVKNIISNKTNEREVILLIGAPASGKSNLCKTFFSSYKIINQDELKTLSNCKKELINTIKNSNISIVIDNTNRNVKTREGWKDFILQYNLKIRYIYLDVPKELSLHINTYRSLTSDKKIPKIAIHSYYKQLQIPSNEEVDTIDTISFYLNKDIIDYNLFKLYLS